MRFKVILSCAFVIAVLVIAGCGGSDSSSSGGSKGESGSTTTAQSEGGETTEKGSEGGESTDGESPEARAQREEEEGKPLSPEEFNTRINEICIQVPPTYEEELKTLEKENGGKKPSKAETNLKAAIPPLESAIEQMKSVTPPASEEQTIEEVYSSLEDAVKGLEEEPKSELSGPKSPFAEFQKITKESGFETCSGL